MGGVISRLRAYTRLKVDEAKSAAWNRVDRAKCAVITKLTDTRDTILTQINTAVTGVVNAVVTRRDHVVARVVNVKNRIVDTKDRAVQRVIATKDATVAKVNRCIEQVVDAKNRVCAAVIHAKNVTRERVTNAKNAVVNSYVSARDRSYARYRAMREAKLTRWQKVKYSAVAAVILTILSIALLTVLDLYLGDYARAEARLQTCWFCICFTCDWLYYGLVMAGTYVFYGLCQFGSAVWYGSTVAGHYAVIGSKWAGHHALVGSQAAAEYGTYGAKVGAEYAWTGTKTAAHYTWLGTQTVATYSYEVGKVVAIQTGQAAAWGAELGLTAARFGCYYAKEGAIVGAQYAASGTAYAYEHGSVALRDGAIRFYHYSIYFLTNFRVASAEAASWTWQASKTAAVATAKGTYHSIVFLTYFTADVLVKIYEIVTTGATWSYATAIDIRDWSAVTGSSVRDWSVSAGSKTYEVLSATVSTTAASIRWGVVSAYDVTMSTSFYVASCVVASAKFTYAWVTYLIEQFAWGLYVAVADYGARWMLAIGDMLVRIFTKFFTDLAVYVINFVRVTTGHIYMVLYVILSFAYYLILGVAGIIRTCLGGAVKLTTAIFSVIIWVLQETLFAYAYAMHKYNMYREVLFMIFIGLMSVYCTGLMRDRRSHREDEDEDEESDDSDEQESPEHDEGDHADAVDEKDGGKTASPGIIRRRLRRKDLDPTSSIATKQSVKGMNVAFMPSHEADSSDDDIPDFTGHDEILNRAAGVPIVAAEEDFLPDQDDLDFAD